MPTAAPTPRAPAERALPSLDLILLRLRDVSPAFRALGPSSWLLFLTLYARIKMGGRTAPTQGELAELTGLSERSVRRLAHKLMTNELLTMRNVRVKTGGMFIVYGLGPVTRVALEELGSRPRAKRRKAPTVTPRDVRIDDIERRLAQLEGRSSR